MHGDAEGAADGLCDVVLVHLDGPDQRIDLAVVRFRILQQGGDDVGLILTGDGGVPPGAHRQSNDAAGTVVAQYQSSHSAKNMGRRCVVRMGVRSSSRSAIQ